jgi:PncC family amidohydrolase
VAPLRHAPFRPAGSGGLLPHRISGTFLKIGRIVFFGHLKIFTQQIASPNTLAGFRLESARIRPEQGKDVTTEDPVNDNLRELAARLAKCLRAKQCRVAFAESCTAGLVSASLAQIPGVSEFHCGSAVVYRLETKTRWLGVPAEMLIDPGPVSEVVARAMAVGVLRRTPEAEWSAAITGHLGPNAPEELDGLAFIGIARRDASQSDGCEVVISEHRLGDPLPPGTSAGQSLRERRQIHAAGLVLQALRTAIEPS